MDGNIVTSAKWFGGSVILASALFALSQHTQRPVVTATQKHARLPVLAAIPPIAPERPSVEKSASRVQSCVSEETTDCVPIIETPINSPPTCLNPPSEVDIWQEFRKNRFDQAPASKREWKLDRITVEKIGEKVDVAKVYPLAGPCQLVRCHYRCTIFFDETTSSDTPMPLAHTTHRVEVIFKDRDYLSRVAPKPESPNRSE